MNKQLPRRRLDPAKTREAILEAAFEVFADKGFDRATLAGIAGVAGVPTSLSQYHFGSKEELWAACLEQKAGPVIGALDSFLDARDAHALENLVRERFRVLHVNPKIARILAWASMGAAPIPAFLVERRERLLKLFAGSPDGALPVLLFSVAAMDGWFLYRDLYNRAFGPAVLEDEFGDRVLSLLMSVSPIHDGEAREAEK